MDPFRKMYKYAYVMLGLVIVSCNQGKNIKEASLDVKEPLMFSVVFDDFGEKQFAFDKDSIKVDSVLWANHAGDSVVYYDIMLNNLGKKHFVFKTGLVASNIPFLIRYSKGKEECIATIEVIQQFNTIHQDSIVINQCEIDSSTFINSVYHVNYSKNVTPQVDKLVVRQYRDTVDVYCSGYYL
jgi:hypothetical protein